MLRFVDSVDHYTTTTQMGFKWSGVGIANFGSLSIGAFGRNGTNGFRVVPTDRGLTGPYILFNSQATWQLGFGLRLSTNLGLTPIVASFQDGLGNTQVDLRVLLGGQIVVTRNGTQLGASTFVLQANVYYFIEFGATINSTTGSVTVRVNNQTVLSLTNVNTQATSNASSNVISLQAMVGTGSPVVNMDYDDIYITDTTGTVNTGFLGDNRVQALFATANGALDQFTANGAASNFQCVNQTTPDDDTTYVSSATAGQIDLYAFGSLVPTAGTVHGVQTVLYARKDDSGSRIIQPEVRQGTTNYAVGAQHSLGTSYTYYLDVLETDPTGAAWTVANINADQFGVQEVS